MSALRLINETTVSSSVSSVNVTDVFSGDFDIYKITSDLFFNSQTWVQLRFINSSGSVISASNYDNAALLADSSATSFSENRGTNESSTQHLSFTGESIAESGGLVAYVFNPYSSSSYSFLLSQGSVYRTDNADNLNTKNISVLKQTASMSGFQILPLSGTIDGATIRTYGLRVDS
jgi:hypothetical protein